MRYKFGDCDLDTDRLELRRHGAVVGLEPQAFDVLVYLVERRQRVVSKEELMDHVWGGRFVSETAVTSRIKQVRRAVGDDGQAQDVVRTHHGRGYRIVADVTEDSATPELHVAAEVRAPSASAAEAPRGVLASSAPLEQDVRFCRAKDGVSLAYAWAGQVPPWSRPPTG